MEPAEENSHLLDSKQPAKMANDGSRDKLLGGSGAGYQTRETQDQVDQVMGIMRNNIDKVLERDSKIQNLNERSDALQVGANQFLQTGTQLKRKMWWKNVKFMIVIGVVAVIVLGVIIGVIVSQTKKKKDPQ